jgi:hypothetical protein
MIVDLNFQMMKSHLNIIEFILILNALIVVVILENGMYKDGKMIQILLHMLGDVIVVVKILL